MGTDGFCIYCGDHFLYANVKSLDIAPETNIILVIIII